jgi:GNAT superfamily N-acetyltransferase
MKIAESNRLYRFYLVFSRMRYGLTLFSIRNILSRTGIDLEFYYWVKEGFKNFIPENIKRKESEYLCKELSFEETKGAVLNSSGINIPLENLKENLTNGQVCLGLIHDNEILAYMFIETKDFVFRNKKIILNKDEAYLSMMYTFEKHRGKNIAPYLRSKSYEKLREKGINGIYSITAYFNTSSKKFKKKLNAKNLKLFFSINLFHIYQKHFLIKSYKY